MSWYKQSLRENTMVEHAQQFMESNRDDIEYLVTVLSRYKELTQDLELIEEMTDMTGDEYQGHWAEDASDVRIIKTEIAQLENVWNNYNETLQNFALQLSRNQEL